MSGSPKILADLRDDGETISRKTVAKTMRQFGLKGVCPKKWKTTTILDHADAYPVDAAKRAWDTGELNRIWIWVGDITYLRTWEGWLYLAIDAHSRRVIGWAIDEHMRAHLVEDALTMAILLRGELPAQVVFHTYRGTQGGFNRLSQRLDLIGMFRSVTTEEFHGFGRWASAAAGGGSGVAATDAFAGAA